MGGPLGAEMAGLSLFDRFQSGTAVAADCSPRGVGHRWTGMLAVAVAASANQEQAAARKSVSYVATCLKLRPLPYDLCTARSESLKSTFYLSGGVFCWPYS